MISIIKSKLRFLKKNDYILFYWNTRRIKKQNRFMEKYSDKEAIEEIYYRRFNRKLDLENPLRFTEKLQWLKLYFRNKEMSICADKYAVRDYLIKKGYSDIINTLIDVWDDVDKINIEKLPEQFVLKAAHGSGMNLIVKDKSKINWPLWKRIMRCWLKQNIYIDGREWPYKNIKPRIICEKYIETNGQDLKDYKFFCFNGEPKFIQVDGERYSNHQRAYYDIEWNYQPFQYGDYDIKYRTERPSQLENMIGIARELAQPFPFSRIDFYNIGDRIIFGEITFFPDSGFASFNPDKYDAILGEMLILPDNTTLKQ